MFLPISTIGFRASDVTDSPLAERRQADNQVSACKMVKKPLINCSTQTRRAKSWKKLLFLSLVVKLNTAGLELNYQLH